MKKSIYLSLIVCLTSAIASNSYSQTTPGDSSSRQNPEKSAVALYYASLGDHSGLYNGPEYYFYDPVIKGNAYFLDVNSFSTGSVYYYGVLYNGVPMLYDLYSDQLVVLLYNHFSKFSLLKDRVKNFNFLGHQFVNIDADTIDIKNNNGGVKSGFYDELYNGKSAVLVKRSKSIQTNTGGTMGAESYFNPTKDFYLRKSNSYYSFSGQTSLLNLLKDKKRELQQYIRANQIKYRKAPEEAMVKIVSYYDHLTN